MVTKEDKETKRLRFKVIFVFAACIAGIVAFLAAPSLLGIGARAGEGDDIEITNPDPIPDTMTFVLNDPELGQPRVAPIVDGSAYHISTSGVVSIDWCPESHGFMITPLQAGTTSLSIGSRTITITVKPATQNIQGDPVTYIFAFNPGTVTLALGTSLVNPLFITNPAAITGYTLDGVDIVMATWYDEPFGLVITPISRGSATLTVSARTDVGVQTRTLTMIVE